VELGYRGSGETLKREEFEARKRLAENARFQKTKFVFPPPFLSPSLLPSREEFMETLASFFFSFVVEKEN
jgi:hypothetical protein